MRRFSLASFVLAAALMATSASPAGGAVTIGQLAPPVPPANCVNSQFDLVQVTVASGNSYAVPQTLPNGVVTSWSHNAAAGPGQLLTMKIFRAVPGLLFTYLQVGHDGPRPLSAGQPNTFTTRIPVQAGDHVGNNDENAGAVPNACFFITGAGSADAHRERNGNLADGQTGFFNLPATNSRLNVTAVVEPDCDNDGFGDETQDTNLSTCAPGTGPGAPGTGPALGPGGTPVFCKGKPATIVGTAGNDVRTGSRGRDVIVGLGGNDTLSGFAGNDLICGGAGKDKLFGGKGKDKLYGQKGKDTLNGGKGKDLCVGGPGKDKAKGCEKTKSI